jgi:hypothetical protein
MVSVSCEVKNCSCRDDASASASGIPSPAASRPTRNSTMTSSLARTPRYSPPSAAPLSDPASGCPIR